MIAKVITYFDKTACVCCDQKCNKAWGISQRPRVQLQDIGVDPDDFYFLADDEIAEEAPANPRTYEGSDAKPTAYDNPEDHLLNKWCVRECERSTISPCGKPGDIIRPQDFSKRMYNKPTSEPLTNAPHPAQ